jgi:hypothetical protein
MLRRYIFVKLKPEYRDGLKVLQILKTAKEALHAAYGVQGLHVGRAADDATSEHWDVCLTLEFVSSVDLERCLKDSITTAFVERFLGPRSENVWMGSFDGEARGARRVR